MRLSEEQIAMAKITYTKVVNDSFVLDLLDTIEALQQENEQLKQDRAFYKIEWAYECDNVLKLQHENEQLKADLRDKDNEINDLKALVDYLRKFKPKNNEAVREGNV